MNETDRAAHRLPAAPLLFTALLAANLALLVALASGRQGLGGGFGWLLGLQVGLVLLPASRPWSGGASPAARLLVQGFVASCAVLVLLLIVLMSVHREERLDVPHEWTSAAPDGRGVP